VQRKEGPADGRAHGTDQRPAARLGPLLYSYEQTPTPARPQLRALAEGGAAAGPARPQSGRSADSAAGGPPAPPGPGGVKIERVALAGRDAARLKDLKIEELAFQLGQVRGGRGAQGPRARRASGGACNGGGCDGGGGAPAKGARAAACREPGPARGAPGLSGRGPCGPAPDNLRPPSSTRPRPRPRQATVQGEHLRREAAGLAQDLVEAQVGPQGGEGEGAGSGAGKGAGKGGAASPLFEAGDMSTAG
jgi:hypothetical protein